MLLLKRFERVNVVRSDENVECSSKISISQVM
jgi:hypothetical protein